MLQNNQPRTHIMKSKSRVTQTKAKVFNKVFRFFDLSPQLRDKIYDYLYDESSPGGTRDELRTYTVRIPRVALRHLNRPFRDEYDTRISVGSHHRLCITDSLDYDPMTLTLPTSVPPLARYATRLDIDLLAALSAEVYDPEKKTDEGKARDNTKPTRTSYNTSLPRRCGGRDEVCREMWYHTQYVRSMLSQLPKAQEVRIAVHLPSVERLLHIAHSGDYFNGISRVAKVEIWCIGLRKGWTRAWNPEDSQKRLVATWDRRNGLVLKQYAVRACHFDGWA